MQIDITAAAIATLISSTISTFVALFINKTNSIKELNNQLDGIIKIAVQYPYLESERFVSQWTDNKTSDNEQFLRYENYCTLVFNFMERLSKYYKYDSNKIQNHVNIKDWARLHKDCWLNPSTPFENADGYSDKFKTLINNYIK